jgi:hypothetical protein
MRLTSLAGALFFLLHATAIIVAAVPEPGRLADVTGERESPDDRLSRHVRPLLDRMIPGLSLASKAAWRATTPARGVLGTYTSTFRLSQGWRMFAQPPRSNHLLAVCVDFDGGAPSRRCEVVNIKTPAGHFKGMLAYQAGFRDKALSNALDAYFQVRTKEPGARPSVRTRFGSDVLGPVARYFAAQWSAPALRSRWVEVWHTSVPMPVRGAVATVPLDLRSWPSVELPPNRLVGVMERVGTSNWTLLRAGPT